MKYRARYEYSKPFGKPRHDWIVIGPMSGIQLHIADGGEEDSRKYDYPRYSGGIEIHYRYPPDYMQDQPPSHDECWVLKCPCWHDGSSLQASEFWIPFWLSNPQDHDRMFEALEKRLMDEDAPISPMAMLKEVADAKGE